jgi:uncharacterized protein (TIGR02646 family)
MRRIQRLPLPEKANDGLATRQHEINKLNSNTDFVASEAWKASLRKNYIKTARTTLCQMAGDCVCCMYCEASEGTDIEHFWPKARYPERMFIWENMLLCCAGCGRYKGDQFPLTAENNPALLDPTVDNPWDYLDFHPETGNIVPKFDLSENNFSKRGEITVEILHLDKREALAKRYKKNPFKII